MNQRFASQVVCGLVSRRGCHLCNFEDAQRELRATCVWVYEGAGRSMVKGRELLTKAHVASTIEPGPSSKQFERSFKHMILVN